MLVAGLKKTANSCGLSVWVFLHQKSISIFFQRDKKNDHFASTKPHFLNFELAYVAKNDALQMPPKDETI